MKNLKNNKGITLIALVITIIVLIILAGISINLLLGDNGIIKKAQEAGERYKVAADEEEEKLANAESTIDRIWQGLGLGDNGQGGNPPVISKDTGSLGTPVNADKYGRIVTNYTAQNLVWRLFYEDANNIYLISETQVGFYPIENLSLINYENNISSPKDSKYATGESVSTQGQALMPLASSLFVSSNTNSNIWATAYLCDTDDNGPWKDYKIGAASWAMGAPTIELFAASYNATHTNHQIILEVENYGYKENTEENWFSVTENGGIYRLTEDYYWWLAGPETTVDRAGLNVGNSDAKINRWVGNSANKARPVVCLQKNNFTCQFEASKDTGALSAPVNSDKYGRIVNNYTAQNLVWRLFYEDSNNIYLISETQDKDYPLNNVQPCNYVNSTYSSKNSKYVSGESVSQQGKDLMPLLGGATSSSVGNLTIGTNANGINLLTTSNTNPNIWATAYLCDTDDDGPWIEYKTGNASWAMGAPTIELFVASYNVTHNENRFLIDIGDYGYTIIEPRNTGGLSSVDNGGIYNLGTNSSSWIASPYFYSLYFGRNLLAFHMFANGYIYDGGLGDTQNSYSVRPVVCLQKVNFTYDLAAQDW